MPQRRHQAITDATGWTQWLIAYRVQLNHLLPVDTPRRA